MRERLVQRQRARKVGTARAGVRSGRFAQERFDSFVRAKAKALLVFLAGAGLFALVLWWILSPLGAVDGFALGMFVTGSFAALYHWCVIASGAVNGTMGQAAEEWTSTELHRLGRNGWRTINHVVFRHADVDHIAVGPHGVLVLETKWRSGAVALDRPDEWLDRSLDQVRRNQRDVAGNLGWGARPDAPIESLLVVWGPEVLTSHDEAVSTDSGPQVVAGRHLRSVLAHKTEARLDPEEVERIYEKLASWVEKKDRWTAERSEPSTPTLTELARDWTERLATGFVGFAAALLGLSLGAWFFVLAAALAVAGVVARRVDRLRALGTTWIVATQAVTVMAVAVIIGGWVTT